MPIKSLIKPETRTKILVALGPMAGLALMISIFLGRLNDPNLDFAGGFLIGLSIVGNLAFIFVVTRYLRKIGGCNDRQKKN